MAGRFLSGASIVTLLVAATAAVSAPVLAAAEPVGSPVGVLDAPSAADQGGARAIAAAFGHDVVVDAATTETKQLVVQADGAMRLTESAVPVRVQRDGGWVAVDSTLGPAAGGALVPEAAAVPVEFSAGGAGALARVQAPSGQWVSVSWSAGSLPEPTVSGSSVTYAEVYPGVDLNLTATSTGMSEVLVVKDAAAAANPALSSVRFGIDDGALTTTEEAGGAVVARSADGTAQLVSPSPTWWDSSSTGASAAGPGGGGLPLPVEHSVTDAALTLDVAAAAAGAGVTYPVYVDPSWTEHVVSYSFVDSSYPTTAYWKGAGASDGYQHVGFINAANSDDGRDHTTRSFWQMDASDVKNKDVITAMFDTTEVYSSSCSPRTVQLWTTGAATASSTWNSQPGLSSLVDSASVAYGYSSSCPAHAVGFDATSAVQRASDAAASVINLGLVAANESDWLGWKKFDSNATLVITYNSFPGQPAWRSVSGCSFVCGQNAYTKDTTPVLTGAAGDADGGNLRYEFQVYAGHSSTPTTLVSSGTSAWVAAGVPDATNPNPAGRWSPPTALNDGEYEYRVRADDGVDVGAWSGGWLAFTVDSHVPLAPALSFSAASDPLSRDPNSAKGTVGRDVESITITPVAADNAYGYIYGTFVGSSPVFPTNPTCGTVVAGFTVSCPGSVGASFTAQIAAVEDTSTFAVETFDAAGNVPGAPAKQTFRAFADTLAPQSSHGWITTDTYPTPTSCSPAVVDSPGSAATAVNLSLSGGACWASSQVVAGPQPQSVLSFGGAAPTASAASPGLADTSKSFTVGAWLNASTTGSGIYRTAVDQEGTNQSAFFLQNTGGYWGFCMSNSDATTFAGDCVRGSAVTVNTWTFVVGVWDAVNHQLRVYVSPDGSGTTPSTGSHQAAWKATGPLYVGRDKIGSALRYWSGSIANPFVVPGVLDGTQIGHLGAELRGPGSL